MCFNLIDSTFFCYLVEVKGQKKESPKIFYEKCRIFNHVVVSVVIARIMVTKTNTLCADCNYSICQKKTSNCCLTVLTLYAYSCEIMSLEF